MGNFFGGPFLGGQSNQYSGSSSSTNQAYPYLSGALSGIIGNAGGASNALAGLLGLGGNAAQGQAFNNWKNSTGYQFGLNQGVNSIAGNAATQGLLNSGGTLKAIDTYGQNYANTQYGNYTSMLQNLLGSGLTGAGVLGSAGYTSQSQQQGSGSSSQGGISGANFIGSLLGK